MKVLYAIQGTGNGHLSRAKEIIPALENRVDLDILISGNQADVSLPFKIKYRYKGLGFVFGRNGGIALTKTLRGANLKSMYHEIKNCPVQEYDLVINDFEPVSAWACKWRKINCISLSHQSALLSDLVPQPSYKDFIGALVLKYYAPAIQSFGFHFKKYDSSIYLPIIRQSIRQLNVQSEKHYTVYLPSYDDGKIIKVLSQLKKIEWHVFSKYCKTPFTNKNVKVFPIEATSFEKSLAAAKGVICGAGFETPAEALYLKKKLLVIPMRGQLEQHYNAASLEEMGVTVLKKLKKKQLPKLKKWLKKGKTIEVNYPDKTQFIVDAVLSKYIIATELSNKLLHEL